MNKKRGRKKGSAVLPGRPDETWDEICLRIIYGSEWPVLALRVQLKDLIKSGSQIPPNYLSLSPGKLPIGVSSLWNKLRFEFERAVLTDDADWFKRQVKAIEKGGSPQRAQFNARVVSLFAQAQGDTLFRQIRADFKRGKFEKSYDLSLTPAGKFTHKMASDIFNALDKRELPNGHLKVEGWNFEKKERVMDAIHDLARQVQFELKKQARRSQLGRQT